MESMSDLDFDNPVSQTFLAEQELSVAHHIIKNMRALSEQLRTTQDRPWNTYIRRAFTGTIDANGNLVCEIMKVPAGSYAVINRVIVGPSLTAPTGGCGLQFEAQTFNVACLVSSVQPKLAFATEDSLGDGGCFINEQETIYYVGSFGAPAAGQVQQGIIHGQLIKKDIKQGLGITIPGDA